MGNNGKVKLADIGLGGRGRGLLKSLLAMDDVEIPAAITIT
ncbi:hypothetical protein [Paenibacillus lignilyticus]|nr:hypothetical protein [Paenibacillus lignilyticus]